jgi:Arc/MetJ family transcription regulator
MSKSRPRKTRATVTLDSSLVGHVKERVGARGVSAYLNAALRRQLQHEAMRAYLARMEQERGPIDPRLRDAVRVAIDASYENVDRLKKSRPALSALLKSPAPASQKALNDATRRAKASVERALGSAVSIEAIGDEILVVHLAEPGKTRRRA